MLYRTLLSMQNMSGNSFVNGDHVEPYHMNTWLYVRLLGKELWMAYRFRAARTCLNHSWRNASCNGFSILAPFTFC